MFGRQNSLLNLICTDEYMTREVISRKKKKKKGRHPSIIHQNKILFVD